MPVVDPLEEVKRKLAQQAMLDKLAQSRGATGDWGEPEPQSDLLASTDPLAAMSPPPIDSTTELTKGVDQNNIAATQELDAISPRDVAKNYLLEKGSSGMEDALNLRANEQLLAGLGRAGSTVGAAIGGGKADTGFWDKMRAGAGYMAGQESKKEELDIRKEDKATVRKEKFQLKQNTNDEKKSEQYGLVRRGMKRGGGLLKQLENRQLALGFISGTLDDIESGKFIPDSQTMKALSAQMSLAQTGTAPQLSIIDATDYQNAKRYVADKMQWLTNNPKEAASTGVLKQFRNQMDVLKRGVDDKYNNLESDLLNSQLSSVLKRRPDLLRNHIDNLEKHVDIETDKDGNFVKAYPKGYMQIKDKKEDISKMKKDLADPNTPPEVKEEIKRIMGGM